MALLSVILIVACLAALIAWAKVTPFLAFLLTAIIAALGLGIPADAVAASIEHGVGDMLGSLAIIICLGAMFGKVIADSGAAQKIAQSLIALVGLPMIGVAMTLTGLLVGIPLFYNVGFVVMTPLVFSLAPQAKLPAVYVGIPMLAGLSIAHGFLPPHPAPTALVSLFGANLGLTLIYGLVVGIPALLIAGPLFALSLKGVVSEPSPLFAVEPAPDAALPGAFSSFASALLPVVLIAATTVLGSLAGLPAAWKPAVALIGQPMIALGIALGITSWSLGIRRGVTLSALMDRYSGAISEVAGVLMILAGAGALKQVFVDSGVNAQLAGILKSIDLPPLVLGWLIAMVIRVCIGSATVAGLTAASIVLPLVKASHVNPNLMVLSIGAGSLMFSHVNDGGFWLFKSYFNLSLKDTFRTWTVMESLAGTFGLIFVLLLNQVV